jgi:hypothetical protein
MIPGCKGSPGKNSLRHGDPALMAKVETEVNVLASRFKAHPGLDKAATYAMLKKHLEDNPHIYGATFAFAPMERGGATVKSSPYVYHDPSGMVEKDLIESYDYVTQEWYAQPVKLGQAVWSAPYFDEGGGNIWMITYSIPVYDSASRLIGVATSDLPIRSE